MVTRALSPWLIAMALLQLEEYGFRAWSVYQFSNVAKELVFTNKRKSHNSKDTRTKINSIRRLF